MPGVAFLVQQVALKSQIQWRWLFGPRLDVLFFLVPIFIGIGCFLCTTNPMVLSSVFLTAVITDSFESGPFHQGPTLFAYWDKQNREYFAGDKMRRGIFLFGPPMVMAISILLGIVRKELLILIWMLWAIQHFIQQNIGILLLYHNGKAGEAVVDRTIESRSQWGACLFFFGIFWQRVILQGHTDLLTQILICGALAAAIYYCTAYVIELHKNVQAGRYINAPAILFWLFSIFGFVPFAFLGNTFFDAYMIPTTVHFFQYIGLNFFMTRNKYDAQRVQDLPWKQPLLLLAVTCTLLVSLNLGLAMLWKDTQIPSLLRDASRGAMLGLALCHFFLDAFLWRFRDPYLRASILPFLKTSR